MAAVQLARGGKNLVHLDDQTPTCTWINERVPAIPAHSCYVETQLRRHVSKCRHVFISPVPKLDGAISKSRCDGQPLDKRAIGKEHFQAEREFHSTRVWAWSLGVRTTTPMRSVFRSPVCAGTINSCNVNVDLSAAMLPTSR